MKFLTLSIIILLSLIGISFCEELFPLSLIHINDFHAKFDEITPSGRKCDVKSSEKCVAGFARLYHTVKMLQDKHKFENPLFINAGDNFQGSLWYNLLRWNITRHFFDLLPPDVMILGNHEFDHGIDGVLPFLDGLKTFTLGSNIGISKEPSFKGKLKSYIIMEIDKRKIGLIGVSNDQTNKLANTGSLQFQNPITRINDLSQKLKKVGVDIIIVISHCGIEEDQKIAHKTGDNVDIIVGGHSHTYLYNGDFPGPDPVEGDYPLVVTNSKGHKVLIVQAASNGKYVGNFRVYFDKNGEVATWYGSPIYQDNNVEQDPEILQELIPWRDEVERLASVGIGYSDIFLDNEECRMDECTLGSLVADAFVNEYQTDSAKPISIVQGSYLKEPLRQGKITFGDIIEAIPSSSTVDRLEITGQKIKDALEYSMTNDELGRFNVLQVSGIKATFNVTNAVGKRLVSLKVRDAQNSRTYLELNPSKFYTVIVSSQLASGGDGFDMLKNARRRRFGPVDIDVVNKYIKKITPIMQRKIPKGRIVIKN